MSHKRFLTAGLATLLVVGLLIMGGTSIYRSGQSQGYMMGRLSAGDDGAMAPYAPYYTGYPGRHFSAIPFLCSAGLFVLLLAGAAKFFRFRTAKMADGPQFKQWAEHWREHHGPKPPWCWWEEPSEEKAEQAPGAESADAKPES